MSGSGFKDWSTGDVVTADEFDGYVMKQVVMHFADATARDAAITSPEEGYHAFLADNDVLTFYDGSAWKVYPGKPSASGDILYFDGTKWAVLAKGSNGQYLTLTAGLPAWSTLPSGPVAAVKTADESVTSSTTLQDDDHLTLSLGSGKTYAVTAMIAVSATGGEFDFTLAFTGTSSLARFSHSTLGGSFQAVTYDTAWGTASPGSFPSSGDYLVSVTAVLSTTSAGTAKVQWAQGFSSASATTVKRGSTFTAVEV